MNEELKAIVQRMIDAGETEENIAIVIKEYNSRGKQEGAQSVAATVAPEKPQQPTTLEKPSPLLEHHYQLA